MSDFFWYVTRATGVVGTVLVVAALLWGFLFSARATGKRPKPAWWLDLHNWMGGLGLTFIGIHVVAAFVENADIGLAQVFVPGTATPDRTGIALGVIATYLMAAAVFTTWPRRARNRTWWRAIHLGSVAGVVFALLHSYESGSDFARWTYQVTFGVLAALGAYGLVERLISVRQHRRRRAARVAIESGRRAAGSAPTDRAVDRRMERHDVG